MIRTQTFRTSHGRGKTNRRAGAAVIELVVCLPVIILLVFASIEACSMIFLRQALSASAYEGVRVGIRPDATNQEVIDRCQQLLDARKVNGASVAIDAADVTSVNPGTPIAITVTATCDANSIGPSWFFGGKSLSATASMVKE